MKHPLLTCCLVVLTAHYAMSQEVNCGPSVSDSFYRFDAQPPWLHGFHRASSPFSGHAAFRPSNYQQVMARSAFTRMYSGQFLNAYRKPSSAERYRMHRAVNSKPISVLQRSQSVKQRPRATPSIQSIRVARPVAIKDMSEHSPSVIRAIQQEETGPLFPLPPLK